MEVADLTALSALPVLGLPDGTFVWVVAENSNYYLDVLSTLPVSSPTVVATSEGAGEPGRWIQGVGNGSSCDTSDSPSGECICVPPGEVTGSVLLWDEGSGESYWLPPGANGSLFYITANVPAWLPPGDPGDVLTLVGTTPTWAPGSGIIPVGAANTVYWSDGVTNSFTPDPIVTSIALGAAGPRSATGNVRNGHGSTIVTGRNNANSGDVALFRWGVEATDTLTIAETLVARVNVPTLTTVTVDGVVATTALGFSVQNTSPATAIDLLQFSPRAMLYGAAWNTASSDVVGMGFQMKPISAVTPAGVLAVITQLNGAVTDGNVQIGAGYIEVGAGPYANGASGLIRTGYQRTLWSAPDDGGTARNLFRWIATNRMQIGPVATAGFTALDLLGTGGLDIYVGTANPMSITSALIQQSVASYRIASAVVSPVSFHQNIAGAATSWSMRAQGSTAAGGSGGALQLQGGRRTTTGFRGAVRLQWNADDATFQSGVELANVVADNRVVSIAFGSDLTSTQMPANAGDLVVFVGNVATEPTVQPVGGSVFYSKSAGILQTQGAWAVGPNPVSAALGLVRTGHAQTMLAGRNQANSADVGIVTWGVVANNVAQFGDPGDFHFRTRANAADLYNATTQLIQWSSAAQTMLINALTWNNTAALVPVISQQNVNAANVFTVRAAGAASGNNNGAALQLQGGRRQGTGFRGSVRLQWNADDATFQSGVELANVVADNRVVSIAFGANLTSTQMPANTGDLVAFWGNAATLPSANPVGGGIVYENAGAFEHRGTSGTVTTMAAA